MGGAPAATSSPTAGSKAAPSSAAASSSSQEVTVTSTASPATPATASSTAKDAMKRTFSEKNVQTGKKFVTSYAKTWIGMSPIYLMAEAVTPGKKVGTQFKAGFSELSVAAEELREAVTTSTKDILIIVDQQLKSTGEETNKTAELIKAAGENAIVVVSTSIAKAQGQIHSSSPEIKQAVLKNGKDCVILVDKALKSPIVVSGVAGFARSKGIPKPEAILQVASMGLAKIIASFPEDGDDGRIRELDAAELERMSTQEAEQEAVRISRAASGHAIESGPSTARKDDSKCIIS